jgi:hypothetical protein
MHYQLALRARALLKLEGNDVIRAFLSSRLTSKQRHAGRAEFSCSRRAQWHGRNILQ